LNPRNNSSGESVLTRCAQNGQRERSGSLTATDIDLQKYLGGKMEAKGITPQMMERENPTGTLSQKVDKLTSDKCKRKS